MVSLARLHGVQGVFDCMAPAADGVPEMKVKCFTRGGGFVREAELPPFQLMPEALIWGSRLFVRNIFLDTTDYFGYSEALGFSLDAVDGVKEL